ncbi:MAG: NAD(P)H-hydrate epimerase [Candidatus Omnitrophota bacterium]
MRYVTSQEMRRLDKEAVEKFGIPSVILMENAGRAVYEAAREMLSGAKEKKTLCVCGRGNNAGDGFVAARHLINNGFDTEIFLLGDPATLRGDAKINYNILHKMKIKFKLLKDNRKLDSFRESLQQSGLLIDAILGTGISGEVKEPFASVINLMNQSKKPILAVDTPSGLDATEGKALGSCIKATKTVTFAFPKTGFIKNDGPDKIGTLVVADISLPK